MILRCGTQGKRCGHDRQGGAGPRPRSRRSGPAPWPTWSPPRASPGPPPTGWPWPSRPTACCAAPADGRFALGLRLVGPRPGGGRRPAPGRGRRPGARRAAGRHRRERPALRPVRVTSGCAWRPWSRPTASVRSSRWVPPSRSTVALPAGSSERPPTAGCESVEERERGVASVSAAVRRPPAARSSPPSVCPGPSSAPPTPRARATARRSRRPRTPSRRRSGDRRADAGGHRHRDELGPPRRGPGRGQPIASRSSPARRTWSASAPAAGEMKRLDDDAVDRAVAALGSPAGHRRGLRGARSAPSPRARCARPRTATSSCGGRRVEAGVRVEVISGFEEARLIHLGVLQAVPVYDRRVLVRRHRRGQHRDRARRAGRGHRGPQPQARGHPADRPLLPGRHDQGPGRRPGAAATSRACWPPCSVRSTASTSPWPARARPRAWRSMALAARGVGPRPRPSTRS